MPSDISAMTLKAPSRVMKNGSGLASITSPTGNSESARFGGFRHRWRARARHEPELLVIPGDVGLLAFSLLTLARRAIEILGLSWRQAMAKPFVVANIHLDWSFPSYLM